MARKVGLSLIVLSFPFIVVLFMMGVINFLLKVDYEVVQKMNYEEIINYHHHRISITDEYMKDLGHYKEMERRDLKTVVPKESTSIKISINNVDVSIPTNVSINLETSYMRRYFGWFGIAKVNTNSKNEELLIVQTIKQEEKWRIIHVPKHGEIYIEIVDLNRLFMHPKYINLFYTTNTAYFISTFTWFTQLPFVIGVFPLVHPFGTMGFGLFLYFRKRKNK